jgi:hypothetical protein
MSAVESATEFTAESAIPSAVESPVDLAEATEASREAIKRSLRSVSEAAVRQQAIALQCFRREEARCHQAAAERSYPELLEEPKQAPRLAAVATAITAGSITAKSAVIRASEEFTTITAAVEQ